MSIESKKVEVEIGGRNFGTEDAAQSYYETIPNGLLFLNGELGGQSAILQLQKIPIKGITSQACFVAYSKDLKLLQKYEHDFVRCVKASIRCAISVNGSPDAAREETFAWKNIEKHIPPIERGPLLRLDANLAAKKPTELLHGLCAEFEAAVERLTRRFSLWLHLLVDNNLIGLEEWTGDEVCRYHYFRYQHTETTEASQASKHTFDETKPFGERNTFVTTKETATHHHLTRERHVHHIVNARMHTVEQYADPLPARIKEFRDSIPSWLKNRMNIIDGQITMEEILQRDLEKQTIVSVEQSVDKYSPAFALPISANAGFNLAGWSADDLKAPTTQKPFLRRVASSVTRRIMAGHPTNLITFSLIIGMAIGMVTLTIIEKPKPKATTPTATHTPAYTQFLERYSAMAREVKFGEAIEFTNEVKAQYGGVYLSVLDKDVRITLIDNGGQNHGLYLLRRKDQPNYGSIDLTQTKLKLPLTLHVLEADENHMRYAIMPKQAVISAPKQ